MARISGKSGENDVSSTSWDMNLNYLTCNTSTQTLLRFVPFSLPRHVFSTWVYCSSFTFGSLALNWRSGYKLKAKLCRQSLRPTSAGCAKRRRACKRDDGAVCLFVVSYLAASVYSPSSRCLQADGDGSNIGGRVVNVP